MPDREHEVTLSFEYPDEPRARVVADALAPEVGDLDEARSTATVVRNGDVVRVLVAADDLVALRAASNSWSRLVTAAERTSRRGHTGPSDTGPSDTDPSGADPSGTGPATRS